MLAKLMNKQCFDQYNNLNGSPFLSQCVDLNSTSIHATNCDENDPTIVLTKFLCYIAVCVCIGCNKCGNNFEHDG